MDKAEELKARIMSFQEERIKMFIKTKDIFYQAVKKPLIITNEEELDEYAQQVKQIDLADAQFVGFKQGKWDANIISLIKSMGLSKTEWEKWKNDYVNVLDDQDFELIEDHFK